MISCTEFIPAYSTLFTYLEEAFGPEAVPNYWSTHFDYTKSGLYRIVKEQGIRGCFSHWRVSLNEEAADFGLYLNEKRGFFLLKMNHCPSKGRLLKLRDEIGVEPYHGYCLHCDYYRGAIEANGLCYIFNCEGADRAACSILIYDPKVFDGRVIIDEDTEIMERTAADNEYFHRAFHSSLNKGIDFLGTNHGEAHVRAYLTKFAENVYRPVYEAIQARGLAAMEEKILDTYQKEHASEAVSTCLNGDTLTVTVSWCPAVKFLQSRNITVSSWYHLSTEVVMEVLAKKSGYQFSMDSYDPETGAAKYRFWK